MSDLTSFCHDPGREAHRRIHRRQARNQLLAGSMRGQLLGAPIAGGEMIVYFAQPFVAAVIQQICEVFPCINAIHETFRSRVKYGARLILNACRARCSRDFTVPMGTSSVWALSI